MADIFAGYLCTHICATCHAAINDPNQNGGFHVCSKTIAGKIKVDGFSSFHSFVLGLCIQHEQNNIMDFKMQDPVENNKKQISLPSSSSVSDFKMQDPVENNKKQISLPSTSSVSDIKMLVPVENNKKQISLPKPSSVLPLSDDLTDPSYLKTMVNIIFLDLDNWGGFFKKLPNRLPKQTFVWGFYGGNTRWYEPLSCGPYAYQKSQKRFYLNDQCGKTKDAADFAICLTVGKMDMCLPSTVHFTILSGDKGFCEIERQMKNSKRKAVVIDPHEAIKMSSHMLYMLIVSVGDN